jgi:2-polyprenyl-6-methoxyphenol hydroxylase-like FAD-dependent oxidoreductase
VSLRLLGIVGNRIEYLLLMTTSTVNVAIIGGGIAGFGAAINLSSIPGVTVDVFEQAKELKQLGGGISIGPNSRAILALLGVEHLVVGASKSPFVHRCAQLSRLRRRKTVADFGSSDGRNSEILLSKSSNPVTRKINTAE